MKHIKTIILLISILGSPLQAAVMITIDFETPDFAEVTELGTSFTVDGFILRHSRKYLHLQELLNFGDQTMLSFR